MASTELHETARAIVADNKGILAADESSGTIKKRFDSIALDSTEENRRAYRDMLFSTPGLEEYVSGVILFDETLRQASADGTPFAKLLSDRGIIPGHQGRPGAKELAVRARRDGDRGSRRPARAVAGVQGPRRPLREVACRDLDRRGDSERVLPPGERPCSGALRSPLPGAGARPDRRAGGVDGRRPRHRDLLPRDQADAPQDLRRALPPADRPRRDAAEAEHGHLRQGRRRRRRARRRSPSGRSAASARPCPRRCPGSSSSPAASRTSRRART